MRPVRKANLYVEASVFVAGHQRRQQHGGQLGLFQLNSEGKARLSSQGTQIEGGNGTMLAVAELGGRRDQPIGHHLCGNPELIEQLQGWRVKGRCTRLARKSIELLNHCAADHYPIEALRPSRFRERCSHSAEESIELTLGGHGQLLQLFENSTETRNLIDNPSHTQRSP
jgi:hypothetical protein